MHIGLFIPCYVNQLFPKAAVASLELLEKMGLKVSYPLDQTCCGQPMANSGFEHLTQKCNENFTELFSEFDFVVAPSGSCVLHIKEHLHSNRNPETAEALKGKVYELVEFLTDVIKIENLQAKFPFKVGLHQSCHGLRGLMHSQMSELVAPPFSKPEYLLNLVEGLELVDLKRKDECCGFGGTFSIHEEAVSVKMGKDRIADHANGGAEYITSADMSCLMHLEGILKRQNSPVKVLHIAEILNAQV
jgi:L-lactate dehydrogenase complex protein LldE